MRRFLSDLLSASEKAAHIARACRKEKDLFQLLIEEKSGDDKNSKFSHDFKTLADVLIQETVRHDLGLRYPKLASNIRGEENNEFTNTLGETIQVSVKSTQEETSKLLRQVLANHSRAADLLARQVHSDQCAQLSEETRRDLQRVPAEMTIDVDSMGIWIDPIDSTINYIRGSVRDSEYHVKGDLELTSRGLQVVTVLIGVYDRATGTPIIGVVNQPFARFDQEKQTWQGQVYWGLCVDSRRVLSQTLIRAPVLLKESAEGNSQKKVIVGSNEAEGLAERLQQSYQLLTAGGAGYKLLCVARGFVDIYVTQKGSIYKWDSCAGHALLRALGGGCLDLDRAREQSHSQECNLELQYHQPRPQTVGVAQWSNAGGVLAFRDPSDIPEILRLLKSKLEDETQMDEKAQM